MSETKATPPPWATDGRMIVQEVEGRSFWSGQPYIADCHVSASIREPGSTAANAELIVRAVNCHAELVNALRLVVSSEYDRDEESRNFEEDTLQGFCAIINKAKAP